MHAGAQMGGYIQVGSMPSYWRVRTLRMSSKCSRGIQEENLIEDVHSRLWEANSVIREIEVDL